MVQIKSICSVRPQATSHIHHGNSPPTQPHTPRGKADKQFNMCLLPRVILQQGEQLDGTFTPLHARFKPVEPRVAQPRQVPQRASIPTRCQPSRPTTGLYLETSKQHQVGQSPTSKTALRSLNMAHALWASVAGRSCSYAMKNHKHRLPLQPQFPQHVATSSPRPSHRAGPQMSLHPHTHLSPQSSSRIKGLTRTHPAGGRAKAHFSSSP